MEEKESRAWAVTEREIIGGSPMIDRRKEIDPLRKH
jgi:hypothetical protein